ncbi:MAG: DUF4329 domain-containing protein [Rhodanobacter sp.]
MDKNMQGSPKIYNSSRGFSTPAEVARDVLNWILETSINSRDEYGGIIYLQAGRYHATPPRTQGYGNTVDVGQREPNMGCPAGTIPVAYYHTHPNYVVSRNLTADYNHFSDEDKDVARNSALDAYLGTLDGSFFKYDRATDQAIRLKGKLKNTSELTQPHHKVRQLSPPKHGHHPHTIYVQPPR